VLAGDLRAGVVLSGEEGMAMALLRVDRVETDALTLAGGRSCRVVWPDWMEKQVVA